MPELDWSALRDFLSVAKTGSLSRAAEQLKISQPTLSRRIAALEGQLNTRLFVRTPRGLLLTDDGEAALEGARRVEQEALSIERKADAAQQTLTGTVKISLTEGLGTTWLPKKLAAFHTLQPGLCVEIHVENRAVDLVRREADIAVRMFRPQQPDLIAKHVGDVVMGLYATKSYLKKHGRPGKAEDLKRHTLVSFEESLARTPAVQRLEGLFERDKILHRSNSFLEQYFRMSVESVVEVPNFRDKYSPNGSKTGNMMRPDFKFIVKPGTKSNTPSGPGSRCKLSVSSLKTCKNGLLTNGFATPLTVGSAKNRFSPFPSS